MKTSALHPDLTRPAQNGVYFVGAVDLTPLVALAGAAELAVLRCDLASCHDKASTLRQLASAWPLPADYGDNWDALADCLRDPVWLPATGHVLLFDHADALRNGARDVFRVLLGVLDDAATFAQESDRPLFAFLALSDHGAKP